MMLSLKKLYLTFIAGLLLAATVSAGPTCNLQGAGSFTAAAADQSHPYPAPDQQELRRYADTVLSEMGNKIWQPSDCVTAAAYSQPGPISTMPALPGAALMSLAGFLCVSLVKDRRGWLAVFVGLFLLTGAGIKIIPRLTAKILSGKSGSIKILAAENTSYGYDNAYRAIGDVGCTHYIGLLRRLAGSWDADGLRHQALLYSSANPHAVRQTICQLVHSKDKGWTLKSISAINPHPNLSAPILEIPAQPAGHSFYIQHSFSAEKLSRGPPLRAGERFFSL